MKGFLYNELPSLQRTHFTPLVLRYIGSHRKTNVHPPQILPIAIYRSLIPGLLGWLCFTWNKKCSDLNWNRRADLFLRVCRTSSVRPEHVFGLLAFPVGSPLAGAGGCSLPKTAFTIVNLVNFEWQSLPRVPNFCVLAHGCLPINCDKPRGEAL